MQIKKLQFSACKFNEAKILSGLKQKRKLGAFINEIIYHYLKKENNLSYTFVDDEALLVMNQQYLKHNTYTDIITFDLTDKNNPFILGDIYISVDRVKDNAKKFNLKYKDELLRVIIHGALHLSGFGDKTKNDKENMRYLEEEWMRKFDLTAYQI